MKKSRNKERESRKEGRGSCPFGLSAFLPVLQELRAILEKNFRPIWALQYSQTSLTIITVFVTFRRQTYHNRYH